MMYMRILLIVLVCLGNKLNAQCVSKTVSLGNFKSVSGKVIKDCIISYSTIGKLNEAKSNVVLFPTWITGKSKEMCHEIVPLFMDTSGFYIVVVDAFGNGISSSPSNNVSFPQIAIRDMVNSQHELLTKHLRINHVKVLMGASMGGFQVLEWLVSYPDFADNAVSILGTPKLSSYDLMLWKIEADLLSMPAADKKSKELAMRLAWNVFLLNSFTPSYWLRSAKHEDVDSITRQIDILEMKPEDFLCQVNAVVTQDIYKSSGRTIDDMKGYIKAKTLIIVSKSDHLVNPQNSIELAKAIGATVLELDNDCGHAGVSCEQPLVKETVTRFLRQ